LWILFLLILGMAFALAGYGIYLDRIIRTKFEGQRWALPARVYARPLELYVGRQITLETLIEELKRLKYHDTDTLYHHGTYKQNGDFFHITTLGFQFWDGLEPPSRLQLRIQDHQITELKDVLTGQDKPLVRLEPALIASIYPTHNEDRIVLTREQLPELLVKTLLAVEDRTFYQHHGVDPKGIIRAAYKNVLAGRTVEGASTLTQQLVKNFYLSQQRTLKRKLNEAYMAILLDYRYSKDEILTAYANEIYMGQDGNRAIHGFGLASQFYFDRSLQELTIPETALLIAILKGPSEYNPRRHAEKVRQRRNLVIDIMAAHQIIPGEEAQQARESPLGLKAGGAPIGEYPAFIELMRRQLQRDYREEDLRSAGLQIFTTLDPFIQFQAEQSIDQQINFLEEQRHWPHNTLETAAVVVSATQGEVLALVGSRHPTFHGFNRAVDAVRSIGSLIKPVIYLTALNQPERFSLVSSLSDRAVNLRIGQQLWQPHNYDRRMHGDVPLYQALVKSYNLATVHLGLDLGIDQVADMLHRLGVIRRINVVPALLLGSVSLTPIEVAQVYQTIAAGGFRAPLRTIREVLDASGQPLVRYPLAIESVVSPEATFLLQWALRKVVEDGTARWLMSHLPDDLQVAGKTGTTNELRDSWFAGFSADKVTVVWIGRDDNKPTKLTGASGALRIWGELMSRIDNQSLTFLPPETIVMEPVCNAKDPIPFHRDHLGIGVSCSAKASQSRNDQEPTSEQAASSSTTESAPAARDAPPRTPHRQAPPNEFLRDFYGTP
jgi:penicillin-binding protein 1B